MFNIEFLMNSLPFMGKGMLGIFIVTTVVVTEFTSNYSTMEY